MPRRPLPHQTRPPNRSSAGDSFDAYAAVAPGLETLVATELKALGVTPRVEIGGVEFKGRLETIARANLWLRTASRVIVRSAAFRAQAFHELERLARAVPWERWVTPGAAVRFRVTSRKSRLYHTGAIEQRLAEAIEHRLGVAPKTERASGEDEENDSSAAQLFVVRVVHDAFTVSSDTSGALLHMRGYRQAIAKAPLRETLAAAMLIASGWTGDMPLIDPLCGSGTIAIEAALLARRMAPGLNRTFAFLAWPEVKTAMWERLRDEAKAAALPKARARIEASDRDRGAIEAASANAKRAEVYDDIDFSVRSLSAIESDLTEGGYVVTNPPYGIRVGEAAKLRDLYARFGQVLRRNRPGWRLSMLSANARLERELRLPLEEKFRTHNGGIPVRLVVSRVAPAAHAEVARNEGVTAV